MQNNVNFQSIVHTARYDMLGSLQMPTPSDFESMTNDEKMSLYEKVFDLHHDVCTFLSSSIYTEELSKKYSHD